MFYDLFGKNTIFIIFNENQKIIKNIIYQVQNK